MNQPRSRREFLISVAGLAAGPVLLGGCKPRASKAQAPQADEPPDSNLDEIKEAATFRPPIPASEPTIRVRVLKVRPAAGADRSAAAIRIGAENQWIRLRRDSGPANGTAVSGPLLVSMDAGGWSIVDGKGFRSAVEGRETIELAALDDWPNALLVIQPAAGNAADDSTTSSPARQYPGTLRLVSRHDLFAADTNANLDNPKSKIQNPKSTFFDIINDVAVDSYLPGVLAGELYKTWQLETFAAQAVAARSFAATEAAVFAGRRHYDVSNTALSQMYLGNTGLKLAQDAVKMTRGLVLAYDNLLVSGYYSSCCGGAAASASDAIGPNPVNDVFPLQGRSGPDVCTAAPVYQWKVTHPIDLLTRRVNAFGLDRKMKDVMNLSQLVSIDIITTNANQRPTRVRLTDDRKNSAELSAENFRRAANFGGANNGPPPPEKPLRSSNFRPSFGRDLVTFDGFGLGHGVGLCQYGAEAHAKAGMKHEEILRWYYPGVELVRAYS